MFIYKFTANNNVNSPPSFEAGGLPVGLPLSEDIPIGTKVFTLKGHDPENSNVTYGIQSTDKFTVDPSTGVITLSKPLDREVNLTHFIYNSPTKNHKNKITKKYQ